MRKYFSLFSLGFTFFSFFHLLFNFSIREFLYPSVMLKSATQLYYLFDTFYIVTVARRILVVVVVVLSPRLRLLLFFMALAYYQTCVAWRSIQFCCTTTKCKVDSMRCFQIFFFIFFWTPISLYVCVFEYSMELFFVSSVQLIGFHFRHFISLLFVVLFFMVNFFSFFEIRKLLFPWLFFMACRYFHRVSSYYFSLPKNQIM